MNFKSLLYEIENAGRNVEVTVNVPSNKSLYEVDLATRKITGPEFISVKGEHYAETIYFLVDRFYDSMDLAQTNCVIQYAIDDLAYVYAVPFCDISTYDGKMIIPWSISLSATHLSGTLHYFIRFYKINPNSLYNLTGVYDPTNAEFSYSLSTLPASGLIRNSLDIEDAQFKAEDQDLQLPERYFEFVNLITKMVDNATIYWHEADNPTEVPTNIQENMDTLMEQLNHMPYIGDNGHWYIGDVDTGIVSVNDYNNLENLPTINGVTIQGDMTDKLNINSTDISELINN